MRITAGAAKGHNLSVPSGVRDLRPTQGIVRLAIFNILGDKVKDASCLDLFSGTGSLGIEAISRGAKECDFVEASQKAIDTLQRNLTHTVILGKTKVFREKVQRFVEEQHGKLYDLIFLDPPYAEVPHEALRLLDEHLEKDGVVIYLHRKGAIFIPHLKNLKVADERNYGVTEVSFLTF